MYRTALIAAGVLVGLIIVAAAVRFYVDAGAQKSEFEASASDPLGLEVRVRGRLALGFSGDLLLVMSDVSVRNVDGAELLRAERATIAVEPLPLLFRQRRIRRIELVEPRISIERGPDGTLNWARRAKPRGELPVLARTRLSLTGGDVRYRDLASGSSLEALGVNAEVRGLQQSKGEGPNPLARFSFRAELACKEIRGKDVSVGDVSIIAGAKNGTLKLDPIAMRLFGGRGEASIQADLSDAPTRYRVHYTLSRFRIQECLRALSPDTTATGVMDLSANLSTSGRDRAEWTRNLDGEVTVRGRELKLYGHDLDREFSRFESSQSLGLVDVGSYFLVGPLGVAVTKGYDFARLVKRSGGSTDIRAIVSSWSVERGKLRARDVAMATGKNRIALRGNLDFVNQRFDSVTVALIDKEGCAKVRQELRGTFQKPELKKPTMLMSLLGPARNVYTRAKDLLPLGPCTAFYEGVIAAPE